MHAFIVLAHQLPEQLARLVDRIATPEDHVFLHLDRRVDDEDFYARAPGLRAREDVTLLPRVSCRWAGFGVVDATLRGLRAAVDSGRPFTHVSLLSGQDYPIKSAEHFRSFLREHPDTVFMEHDTIPTGQPGGELARVDRRFYHVRGTRYVSFPNRYLPFPRKRPFPLGFTPYKGGAYWTMPLGVAHDLLAFTGRHPEYARFFRRVLAPDESFFQSVIVNTEHAPSVVDDTLRFIDWPLGSHHPRTLGAADLPRLEKSPDFFARKFDTRVDATVLDEIDARLLRRA